MDTAEKPVALEVTVVYQRWTEPSDGSVITADLVVLSTIVILPRLAAANYAL